jgi:hypothetical protein
MPEGAVAVDATARAEVERWLDGFISAIGSPDPRQFAELFTADGYWKDILAFTGSYRTFSTTAEISRAWQEQRAAVTPANIRISADRTPPRLVRRSARSVIEAYFDFDTAQGHATGFARLIAPDDGASPKAWILLTTLQSLHGYEERIGALRPRGVEYSQNFAGDNWLDERIAERKFEDRDPEVLVVGGGQGGLIMAARLRQMGVDALVVEKLPRVGDNWRRRYHSLTLHNEVWANSLPYMPFPPTWPTFVPKDKLAAWLEAYAEAMELNVWTSTEMTSAQYDDAARTWTVQLRQDGSERTVRARHLILAVGGSTGAPNLPALPGLGDFAGDVVHSSQFASGVQYAGRRAIVIGAGTSGHDVAQDLYANGATSVTMVQRGPTCVVSLVPSGTMVYAVYSEGPPAEDVDLITAAIPYRVLRETYQWLTNRTSELDKDLLDGLRRVGFKVDSGPDNTGFHMMYLRRGGGYYINVGCSELIADCKIGLLQAEDIARFTADGLTRTDGTTIPADLVVLATGYRNLENVIAARLGDDVAARVGPVWGFNENHVMRNMWQRTAQPGLWIMGGSLIDARLYSRFLAVQVVADLRDVALPQT